jgi:site-specific recombinase XerD
MASVIDDPNGRRRIQFVAPDNRRRSIRLGKCDRRSADAICRHVQALLSGKINGQPLSRETAHWLTSIGASLKEKLASTGLIELPKQALLDEFLKGYVLSRRDVKPATLEVWQQPCRNLVEFFGADKPLRNITTGDGEQFKAWLQTQKLASATIARWLSFARTFLHVARKHRLIEENPFAEVKIPAANMNARQCFVGMDTINRLLELANPTWRIIIALSRLGGLRCPTEVLSLEWRHIDWDKNLMMVISPKTERYEGKESRTVPIFKELRQYLEEAREHVVEGQTHVVGGNYLATSQGPSGWKATNLRTTFEKLIRRAGLEPWAKPFHNLRSSRETELLDEFPVHVVAKWMGHDAKVSLKHYTQITESHFSKAIGEKSARSTTPTESQPKQTNQAQSGGAKSGAVDPETGAQNVAQQVLAVAGTTLQTPLQVFATIRFTARDCKRVRTSANSKSGEGGIRTRGGV